MRYAVPAELVATAAVHCAFVRSKCYKKYQIAPHQMRLSSSKCRVRLVVRRVSAPEPAWGARHPPPDHPAG